MKLEPTEIPEVLLVEPDVHRDDRGLLLETFQERRYAEAGIRERFVQDNHSRSARGTLRGLHAQLEPAQGKLVRATAGEIFDVAVDLRRGAPTFGRWVGRRLSGENFRQLWVPPGFAHGFCVLSETADVEYKCSALYAPAGEITVAWDDPAIGIDWPVRAPVLSERDRRAPRLAELEERLPLWEGRGRA